MQLATTLRSVIESNRRHWPIEVYVLTDGFSENKRHRIVNSLPSESINLTWIQVNLSEYDRYHLIGHISRITFARLRISEVLPESVGRLLYLDCDILVLRDLSLLCTTDLGDSPLGAVRDYYIQESLQTEKGILPEGLCAVHCYFNAGVLLVDLEACRMGRFFERAADYLVNNPNTPFSDQDALNVAFDGVWKGLDDSWNRQSHHSLRLSNLSVTELPGIVHFVTSAKPWNARSASRNARMYNSFRDRTLFRRTFLERIWDSLSHFTCRILNRFQRFQLLVSGNA